MRRNLPLLLIFVVLLAACGGSPTAQPTANSVQQNTAPTSESATSAPPATVVPREYATDAPLLPAAGTLVTPATEDPEAGKVFDTLTFTRTGGLAAQAINIQLAGTGALMSGGKASQITPDQVNQIVKALDDINFFGLDGVFTAPGTSPDAYHYELTVERDGASRTLKAEDGFIPAPMALLFAQIAALGGQ